MLEKWHTTLSVIPEGVLIFERENSFITLASKELLRILEITDT